MKTFALLAALFLSTPVEAEAADAAAPTASDSTITSSASSATATATGADATSTVASTSTSSATSTSTSAVTSTSAAKAGAKKKTPAKKAKTPPRKLPEEAKSVPAEPAYNAELPIVVQYYKTGRENEDEAVKLGEAEVDNSNPCVLRMRRELMAFESSRELGAAARSARDSTKVEVATPRLVLRYMNESMQLQFQLLTPAIRSADGVIYDQARVAYRKAVSISARPGSWQERLNGDLCHVTDTEVTDLENEIREADRLEACRTRKKELLSSSEKVSNYIHTYLPVAWIDEARRQLELKNEPVGDLLREDITTYRQSEASFRECQRGLALLEEEAASSVRVLNEVRSEKKVSDVPSKQIRDLESRLSGTEK